MQRVTTLLFTIALAAVVAGAAAGATGDRRQGVTFKPFNGKARVLLAKGAAVGQPLSKEEVAENAAFATAMKKYAKPMGKAASEGVSAHMATGGSKARAPQQAVRGGQLVRFAELRRALGKTGAWDFANGVTVVTLNVGNADAILVHYQSNRFNYNMLIDSGRSGVTQLLQEIGIRKIHDYVLTHAHADHIRGAKRLLQSGVRVNDVIHGKADRADRYGRLKALGLHRGTWRDMSEYDPGMLYWAIGQMNVRVVNLPVDGHGENMYSLAVDVRYNGKYALFTGDAEYTLQRAWMTHAGCVRDWSSKIPGHMDFFKAPHHGAFNGVFGNVGRTEVSPLWQDRTHGGVAVSTGGHQGYGHPNPHALQHYLDHRSNDQVRVYLTRAASNKAGVVSNMGHIIWAVAADGEIAWRHSGEMPVADDEDEPDFVVPVDDAD